MVESWNEKIVNLGLNILNQDIYVDSKVISYAFKILNQSSNNEFTKQLVEPHMEQLLTQWAIRGLVLTKKELYDFEINPVDHIRLQHDITFTFFSAKASALEMINLYTKYKWNVDDPDLPKLLFPFL